MPPKKKQPKDKAKSTGGKSAKGAPLQKSEGQGEGEAAAERVVTETEALLQQEHDQLALSMETFRKRLDTLRRDNEFLQEEAQRVRVESQEYMSYMSKRTQKRENTIITLSDQNQKDLEDLRRQREELLSQFREKEAELNDQLLQKENKLAHLGQEIQELQPIKDLQQEQIARIKELEQEVMATRAKNAETLLQIKGAFLHDKAAFREDSEQQVLSLGKEAQEEAERFMKAHNEGVVQENQQLRQELLHLIRRSRVLQAHKLHLERQNKQLVQEAQYSQAMERCRRRQQLEPFLRGLSIEELEDVIKGSPNELQ
ncbi:coiled-coil domain-containing protein 121 [Ambystoma mexicanum]|uniref:coiled-coil domain-containing protein 121 n=1 Tax=Ambystoma mexicanum TaxID=8296 RepID=UPI0037E711D9